MVEGQREIKQEERRERGGESLAEEEAETEIQVWHIDRLKDGYLYD